MTTKTTNAAHSNHPSLFAFDVEKELLREKRQAAKIAMVTTAHDIRGTIDRVPDVSAWVRRYPWWSLAAATAAGFSLGMGKLTLYARPVSPYLRLLLMNAAKQIFPLPR